MEFLKRPYLWVLPVLLVGLFGLDKIFLIPAVRDRFIQPGGITYYRQRRELLQLLEAHRKAMPSGADRTVVVLGDSRSFGLSRHVAAYAGYSNPDIWNFAGPQAVPAYQDYLLEKMLAMPNPPKRFILGLSPDGMSRNAGIFGMPNLVYGIDRDWIDRNRTLIPQRDYETYERSRMFALQGLQFSFGTLFSRIQGSLTEPDLDTSLKKLGVKPGQFDAGQLDTIQKLMTVRHEDLSYYSYEHSPHRLILNATGGAQLAWFGRMPDAQLKGETDQLVSLYLRRFIVSQEQMFFLERALRRIHDAGGKAVMFWPAVNPHLRHVYETEPAISGIWTEAGRLAAANGIQTVNFNEPGRLKCEDYYDASHLSVTCFPDIMRTLLEIVLEAKPDQKPGTVLPGL